MLSLSLTLISNLLNYCMTPDSITRAACLRRVGESWWIASSFHAFIQITNTQQLAATSWSPLNPHTGQQTRKMPSKSDLSRLQVTRRQLGIYNWSHKGCPPLSQSPLLTFKCQTDCCDDSQAVCLSLEDFSLFYCNFCVPRNCLQGNLNQLYYVNGPLRQYNRLKWNRTPVKIEEGRFIASIKILTNIWYISRPFVQ